MVGIKELLRLSREMRKNPTPSEKKAMDLLKKAGIKYKSQCVFGFYIPDIIVTNRLLIVEIDGKIHDTQRERDQRRDKFLKDMGMKVLRVRNENVASIVKKVKKYPIVKGYKDKFRTIKQKAAKERKVAEIKYNDKF